MNLNITEIKTITGPLSKESIWKFNKCVGWTKDTLDCCRKFLQPHNVVKFIFLHNSPYLSYLNNKNHKVRITDSEFISSVFIVSERRCQKDSRDIDKYNFCLSIDILSAKNSTLNFRLKSYHLIYWLPFW